MVVLHFIRMAGQGFEEVIWDEETKKNVRKLTKTIRPVEPTYDQITALLKKKHKQLILINNL